MGPSYATRKNLLNILVLHTSKASRDSTMAAGARDLGLKWWVSGVLDHIGKYLFFKGNSG